MFYHLHFKYCQKFKCEQNQLVNLIQITNNFIHSRSTLLVNDSPKQYQFNSAQHNCPIKKQKPKTENTKGKNNLLLSCVFLLGEKVRPIHQFFQGNSVEMFICRILLCWEAYMSVRGYTHHEKSFALVTENTVRSANILSIFLS